MKPLFAKHPIRQVAYFVPDVEAAARRHAATFGSGPYFVARHIPLCRCEYRGRPGTLDHSSAYGQWGEVMIEFVQQNNPGPSVFKDLYPEGQGLHHVALIVDSLDAARQRFEASDCPTALYAEVTPGVGFAMMDCRRELGHFVELYEPTPPLLAVYETVRTAAVDFDGENLIRPFSIG